MRKPLVIANWKMNGSCADNEKWAASFNGFDGGEAVDVVVCPPYMYIAQMGKLLGESDVILGCQDLNERGNGAFTGEVSASMLIDYGCRYVIVGHSERRRLFGDNDERVGSKVAAAIKCGIVPVLCVGETIEQHEAGKTEAVLAQQIMVALRGMDVSNTTWALAYEPIWAIGTGNSASADQVEETCDFIRNLVLANELGDGAQKVRVLYGGSVNKDNVESLFCLSNVDGGLIGGASLDGSTFRFICDAAKSCVPNQIG